MPYEGFTIKEKTRHPQMNTDPKTDKTEEI